MACAHAVPALASALESQVLSRAVLAAERQRSQHSIRTQHYCWRIEKLGSERREQLAFHGGVLVLLHMPL